MDLRWNDSRIHPDMIFVQTFTLPDFEAKNLHRKSELCGLVHERLNSNNDYISVIWAFFRY